MSNNSGPPPILFILIFIALGAGGYWYFFKREAAPEVTTTVNGSPTPTSTSTPTPPPPPPSSALPSAPLPTTSPVATSFSLPSSVPAGTTVKIEGSTSMVTINQNLKNSFEAKFPGTTITTQANGSEKGIQQVLAGQVDIAAISRPLSSQEQSQGLVAMPVANDQIAVVVGKANPFTGGLTADQVLGIFTGKIQDWSAVGGSGGPIQVVNRPRVSGTHQSFQKLALKGQGFGTTPNVKTLEKDTTTFLLRELKNNGIGYATFAQVASQQTVRVVAIDGISPGTANYPFQRQLFYVYKNQPNSGVKAFLGYVSSPEGQHAINRG